MFGLGFHLVHGFQSAFRTLGLDHQKYFPIIRGIGWLFAVMVPALFASMPIYFYFR
jgi:succinate dehydrogenase / fumarate reductase cytochrome b subunit